MNVDRTHKLIRRNAVTDAAVHDSGKLDGLLHRGNTLQDVFGDSAYRSAANEATLKGGGLRSRIHVRAARGHPLSKVKAAANRAKSRIRARLARRRPRWAAGWCAPLASDQDRVAKFRLQHAPASDARTQGLRGGVRTRG